MIRSALAALLLLAPPAAQAQQAGMPDLPPGSPAELLVDPLIRDWEAYHARCRGGPGDDPDTFGACGARDYAGHVLGALGWCHAEGTGWIPCAQGGSRLSPPPS